LYLRYKKICDYAYNLHPTDLKGLLKKYEHLNRAYTARIIHQKYAYVPECRDKGHQQHLDWVQEEIERVEDALQSHFSMVTFCEQNVTETSDDDEHPMDSPSKEPSQEMTVQTAVEKKRLERQKQDEEEAAILKKYVSENESYRQVLAGYHDVMMNFIASKVGDSFLTEKHLITINVTASLLKSGYFDSDFVPEKCSCDDGRCEGIAVYIVRSHKILCMSCTLRRIGKMGLGFKRIVEIVMRYWTKLEGIFVPLYREFQLYGWSLNYHAYLGWKDDKYSFLTLQNDEDCQVNKKVNREIVNLKRKMRTRLSPL
jgi:hypothetical protein